MNDEGIYSRMIEHDNKVTMIFIVRYVWLLPERWLRENRFIFIVIAAKHEIHKQQQQQQAI